MKTKIQIITIIVFGVLNYFVTLETTLYAQQDAEYEILQIFKIIEEGLGSGEVSSIYGYLDHKTFISLANGVYGYYSSNQAYYVIQDFLTLYKPINLRFTNIYGKLPAPSASGSMKFSSKSMRGNARVFVSLKLSEGVWRISQITIN